MARATVCAERRRNWAWGRLDAAASVADDVVMVLAASTAPCEQDASTAFTDALEPAAHMKRGDGAIHRRHPGSFVDVSHAGRQLVNAERSAHSGGRLGDETALRGAASAAVGIRSVARVGHGRPFGRESLWGHARLDANSQLSIYHYLRIVLT